MLPTTLSPTFSNIGKDATLEVMKFLDSDTVGKMRRVSKHFNEITLHTEPFKEKAKLEAVASTTPRKVKLESRDRLITHLDESQALIVEGVDDSLGKFQQTYTLLNLKTDERTVIGPYYNSNVGRSGRFIYISDKNNRYHIVDLINKVTCVTIDLKTVFSVRTDVKFNLSLDSIDRIVTVKNRVYLTTRRGDIIRCDPLSKSKKVIFAHMANVILSNKGQLGLDLIGLIEDKFVFVSIDKNRFVRLVKRKDPSKSFTLKLPENYKGYLLVGSYLHFEMPRRVYQIKNGECQFVNTLEEYPSGIESFSIMYQWPDAQGIQNTIVKKGTDKYRWIKRSVLNSQVIEDKPIPSSIPLRRQENPANFWKYGVDQNCLWCVERLPATSFQTSIKDKIHIYHLATHSSFEISVPIQVNEINYINGTLVVTGTDQIGNHSENTTLLYVISPQGNATPIVNQAKPTVKQTKPSHPHRPKLFLKLTPFVRFCLFLKHLYLSAKIYLLAILCSKKRVRI